MCGKKEKLQKQIKNTNQKMMNREKRRQNKKEAKHVRTNETKTEY